MSITKLNTIMDEMKRLGIGGNNTSGSDVKIPRPDDETIVKYVDAEATACIYIERGEAIPTEIEQYLLKTLSDRTDWHRGTVNGFADPVKKSKNSEFCLYGIFDEDKGRLVSNLTNPRHKYWDNKKSADSTLSRALMRDADRKLKVVTIRCKIEDE